jgi:hypothetical protein
MGNAFAVSANGFTRATGFDSIALSVNINGFPVSILVNYDFCGK